MFFEGYGDYMDLHVPTHSYPTRRPSDLPPMPTASCDAAKPEPKSRNCGATCAPLATVTAGIGTLPTPTPSTPGLNRPSGDSRNSKALDRKSTRLNSSH